MQRENHSDSIPLGVLQREPSDCEWNFAPSGFRLQADEIHVWRAPLACDTIKLRQFEEALTDDERRRADQYFFERDRKYFIASRGILRELLATYTHRSPADVQFRYGPQGKPSLDGKIEESIRFNMSHSYGMAVFAFGLDCELGIDLEFIRPEIAIEEIAQQYFSRQELREFRALPSDLRPEGFFLCWTRKEAYIKARGLGLQIPLDSFSVSLTPDAPERLVSEDSERWSMQSLRPFEGFAGAVIGEGSSWRINRFDWHP